MYIPKNRIKPNLYTPGDELMLKSNKEIYVGYYHSLWNGKIFSGKNQNEKNKVELVEIAPQSGPGTPDLPPALETTNVIALFLNDPDPIVDEDEWNQGDIVTYLRITNQDTEDDQPREVPYQQYPQPTEDDYSLGVFTRYFCVKINQDLYLELDKEQYNKLKDQDEQWLWEQYLTFSIQWTLIGERNAVIIANRNQTLIAQRRIKKLGLAGFLNEDWDKYYRYTEQQNLYTEGKEYRNRRTGLEYIGPYHIHKSKGPMVGAFHTPTKHDFLDPYIQDVVNRTTMSVEVTSSIPTSSPSNTGYTLPPAGGGSSGGGY